MRRLRTSLTVIGAITILVLAANTVAYAATGGTFILGHKNTASKVSTLKRTTAGPALRLKTSSSSAPLQVNGTGKVANLDADLLDGVDSSAMMNRAYVYTTAVAVATNGAAITVPLPPGNYFIGYSAALAGAQNGYVDCYFELGGSTHFGESIVNAGPNMPTVNGLGYVAKAATAKLELICLTAYDFTVPSGQPIQIVAVPLSSVVTDSPTAGPAFRQLDPAHE